MARDLGELLGLEHEMRAGIRNGEFSVHYQPEIDLATGAVVGVEALMRWHSPTRGSVPPARFIPIAEATGLILPLGEFVLREACRQASAWRRDGLVSDRFVTWVNLSGQQLSSGGVCDLVRDALHAHDLPGESLGLEVTETAIVAEGPAGELARTELEELHNLGVHIAIDDFGTGFSSLAQLRRFPIDVIKIDGSFVQGAEHDMKAAAITANIVNLAQVLGLRTIAEGIESDGQLSSIRRLGCDVAQGFLFAHPVSAEELTPLFESQHSWAAFAEGARSRRRLTTGRRQSGDEERARGLGERASPTRLHVLREGRPEVFAHGSFDLDPPCALSGWGEWELAAILGRRGDTEQSACGCTVFRRDGDTRELHRESHRLP